MTTNEQSLDGAHNDGRHDDDDDDDEAKFLLDAN